jgi:5-formyltetrahydrofolate cyclo-ligase
MTIDDEKRALRRSLLARPRRPREALEAEAERAQARLLESDLLPGGDSGGEAGGQAIALYRPLSSEVRTGRLEEELSARGCTVVFPRVEQGARVLQFFRFLRTGPAAVPEVRSPLGLDEPAPDPAAEVPLSRIAAFVLPGLAADPSGARLGRGRGHYDATLAAAPHALRLMLLFEDSLVARLPVGEHDARLDALCTGSRILRFPPRPERPGQGSRHGAGGDQAAKGP